MEVESSLTNEDFRKLLGQNRGPRFALFSADNEGFQRPKPLKPHFKKLKHPEKLKPKEQKEEYRDRAQERREEKDPQELPQAIAELDIEKSKYLGGSEETTHMVKGLDYALLARFRQKEEKNLEEEMEAIAEAKAPVASTAASAFASSSSALAALPSSVSSASSSASLSTVPTNTAFGRALRDSFRSYLAASPALLPLSTSFSSSSSLSISSSSSSEFSSSSSSSTFPSVSLISGEDLTSLFSSSAAPSVVSLSSLLSSVVPIESFLPARMTFEFDLDLHTSSNSIPTAVLRSKADCPVEEDRLAALVSEDVFGQVSSIFQTIRAGSRAHKKKKAAAKAAAIAAATGQSLSEQRHDDAKAEGRKAEQEDGNDDDDMEGLEEGAALDAKLASAPPRRLADDANPNQSTAPSPDGKKPSDGDDVFPDAGRDYVATPAERAGGARTTVEKLRAEGSRSPLRSHRSMHHSSHSDRDSSYDRERDHKERDRNRHSRRHDDDDMEVEEDCEESSSSSARPSVSSLGRYPPSADSYSASSANIRPLPYPSAGSGSASVHSFPPSRASTFPPPSSASASLRSRDSAHSYSDIDKAFSAIFQRDEKWREQKQAEKNLSFQQKLSDRKSVV